MSSSSPAAGTPGRLFGLLRVAFDQALGDILGRVGPDHPGLRPAHVKIFRFGGIDGSHGAELAAHAGMTKQSMHETLAHLEEHGYLVRRPDPDHARVRVVELTEAGRALERQVHRAIAEVVESWAAQVGEARLDEMWATLEEITGQPAAPSDLAAISGRGSAPRS